MTMRAIITIFIFLPFFAFGQYPIGYFEANSVDAKGGRGDGQPLAGLSMNENSDTVTASSPIFKLSDVGKLLSVDSCSWDATNLEFGHLIATVVTFVSSTQVVVNDTAGISVSGKTGFKGTDNTLVIQAMLSSGGDIIFGEGIYLVKRISGSNIFTVQSNTSIRGKGQGVSVIRRADGDFTRFSRIFATASDSKNISFSNLTIDGNREGSTNYFDLGSYEHQHAIFSTGTDNLNITDVEIRGTLGDGIYLFGDGEFSTITNCFFHDITRVHINVTQGKEVIISNCHFWNITGNAIKVEQNELGAFARNVKIIGCDFYNETSLTTPFKSGLQGTAIGINGLEQVDGKFSLSEIVIDGCNFEFIENCTEGWLFIENVTFSNCTAKRCKFITRAGSYTTSPPVNSRNILISHVVADSSEYVDAGAGFAANLYLHKSENLTVSNITSNDSLSFRFNQCPLMFFTNNRVTEATPVIFYRAGIVEASGNYLPTPSGASSFVLSGNTATFPNTMTRIYNNIGNGVNAIVDVTSTSDFVLDVTMSVVNNAALPTTADNGIRAYYTSHVAGGKMGAIRIAGAWKEFGDVDP